jgi:3-carboxy-cis,cis-muconate cycloisomerase
MTDPLPPSSLLTPLFSSAEMRAVLDDRARLQRMLDFEAALARAEAAVGVVLPSHAGAIADSCRAELYDLAALAEAAVPAGNLAVPLVAALTAEVAKRNSKAAEHVHWGATGQDVIDTALALELRGAIDALLNDLDRATKAFTALAGRHRRNMTVARTLLQQALPMPFGLKLAGYAAALARSRDRLRRLRKDALVLQFGGAAGTLASLGEKGLDVSERLAALLDLTVPDAPWHSHRDRLAEVAAAFAILAGTCGKIARDVALLMQGEIAEAFEPTAANGDNSSTLPRQRNPVGAAAALSAAMVAPNLAATILNAQIQEHERSVGGWQTEWVTFPALALTVSGALHAVVTIAEGLTVDVDRMKANLEASGGLVLAEAVAVAVAEKLGKTEAHELVIELTRQATKEKRAFKDVVAVNEQVRAHFNAVDLERLFMPNHYQGAAQTFIDRLVASSQGRAVRRSSSVSHLTDPKMPSARPDHLSAIKAATSAVKAASPVDEARAAGPQPGAAAAVPTELGQAVAAASALIDQTISELARPPAPPSNAPAEPVPAAASAPEPAPPVQEPAPAAASEPAPAEVADAPSIDQPEEEAPGALLEVFARAAENENVEPDGDNEPKQRTG